MTEIDHQYTREVVCPHCGYVHSDSWEFGDGEDGDIGDHDCGSCGKMFRATRHIHITYSTEVLP